MVKIKIKCLKCGGIVYKEKYGYGELYDKLHNNQHGPRWAKWGYHKCKNEVE